MTTKQDMLKIAAELKIIGRHDMTKEQLDLAIHQAQSFVTVMQYEEEHTVPVKRVRTIHHPSGNRPYECKFYYITQTSTALKLPKQVVDIFKAMYDAGATGLYTSMTGPQIAEYAVSRGYLVTKSDPAVIFAYYARLMEKNGMVFAGYFGEEGPQEDLHEETEEGVAA